MLIRTVIISTFLLGTWGTSLENEPATESSSPTIAYPAEYADYLAIGYSNISESPYFDLTDLLNSENLPGIEYALQSTTNVYYSTDLLVSELPHLFWLAHSLEQANINFTDSPKKCLMISFKITSAQLNDIDWRHMDDVLGTANVSHSGLVTDNTNLQTFSKYVCKVLLDFQIDTKGNTLDYAFSQSYARKWDISFTKYAKDTINRLFGAKTQTPIPVGVLYSEHQVHSKDQYLLEQEIRNADFLILNTTFSAGPKMPLTYSYFMDHLFHALLENIEFTTNITTAQTTFMLTWQNYKPECVNMYSCSSDWTTNAVFKSAERKFHHLFQKFVSMDQIEGKIINVISGTTFQIQSLQHFSYNVNIKSREILAPLYIQRSGATACQMRTMLDQVSRSFDTLLVNEFSWSALSRNMDKIVGVDTTENCPFINQPPELPEETMLFASEGIGHHWNKTRNAFKSLLSDDSSLEQMNLSTIVFSSNDVEASLKLLSGAKQYYGTGIMQFLREWGNKTKVGCLVDVSRELYYGSAHIGDLTKSECLHIFKNSTLIVWKYKVEYMALWEFYKTSSSPSLLKMLGARIQFLKNNPDKQVIFMIEPPNNHYSRGDSSSLANNYAFHDVLDIEFENTLFSWAKVYDVKVIFKPAFNLKYPRQGYFVPPPKDGSFAAGNESTLFVRF